MPPQNKKEKTIKSTRTAFDIIDIIARGNRPSISEIAAEVDYSRSSVHYHLKTLRNEGCVVQDEGGFRLSLRMARLGNIALQEHNLSGLIEGPAEDLASESELPVCVAVEERNNLVWLYHSNDTLLAELQIEVGDEAELHATAHGQAILSAASPEAIESFVETCDLPAQTPKTLTDKDDLTGRLETIRELGFAYSADENVSGICSIAAPIRSTADQKVVGSIGVTARTEEIENPYKHAKARRFSDELPELVQRSARIIENKLPETEQ